MNENHTNWHSDGQSAPSESARVPPRGSTTQFPAEPTFSENRTSADRNSSAADPIGDHERPAHDEPAGAETAAAEHARPSMHPEKAATPPLRGPSPMFAAVVAAVGLLVIAGTVVAGILGWRLIERSGQSVAATLDISASIVATIEDTIEVADTAVGQAEDGLGTISAAVSETGRTLQTAGQVMSETARLVESDIPDGIESVRQTMPALIQSAQLIDGALGALSFAGIDFAPQRPPQDSLAEVDTGLAEVAAKLRGASSGLAEIGTDFGAMSGDVTTVTADLGAIVATLQKADVLLDEYRAAASSTAEIVADTAGDLDTQISDAKLLLVLVLSVIALGQFLPIVGGTVLSRGRTT